MATKIRKSNKVESSPVESVHPGPLNPRIAALLDPSWYKDMTDVDGRPSSMIDADLAMGKTGPTVIGRLITKMQESFRAYRGAGINTHNGLWFYSDVDTFVRYMRDNGHKRGAAIKEAVRYLIEVGAPKSDTNINGGLQMYGFALLATNAYSFDQVPKEWMQTHSVTTLLTLMKAVERDKDGKDDCSFRWKNADWKVFALSALESGKTGNALVSDVAEHVAKMDKAAHELAMRDLTEEQREQAKIRAANDLEESKVKSVETVIGTLAKKIGDTSLSMASVRDMLAKKAIIPKHLDPSNDDDAIAFLTAIGIDRLPALIGHAFGSDGALQVSARLATSNADLSKSA